MTGWTYDAAAAMAKDPSRYRFDSELGQWVLAPKVSQKVADSLALADITQKGADDFKSVDQKLYDHRVKVAIQQSEQAGEHDSDIRRMTALAEASTTIPKPAMPTTPAEYDARLHKLCTAALEWGLRVAVVVGDPGMRGSAVVSRNPLRITRAGNTGDVLAQGDLADVERAVLQFIADSQKRAEHKKLLEDYHAKINAERAEGLRRANIALHAPEIIEAMRVEIDALKAQVSS